MVEHNVYVGNPLLRLLTREMGPKTIPANLETGAGGIVIHSFGHTMATDALSSAKAKRFACHDLQTMPTNLDMHGCL